MNGRARWRGRQQPPRPGCLNSQVFALGYWTAKPITNDVGIHYREVVVDDRPGAAGQHRMFLPLGLPTGLLEWPGSRCVDFVLPLVALGMLLAASTRGYLTMSFSSIRIMG